VRRVLFVLTAAALMAAMTAASALPAFAQNIRFNDNDDDFRFNGHGFHDFGGFNGGNGNEAESGEVDLEFSVSNTGDYASQCVPAVQFGNSGNFNNSPSFGQFGSLSDDFESGGIEVSFAPEQAVDCSSTVQQSSGASSWYGW
jgi:hypothetical protein